MPGLGDRSTADVVMIIVVIVVGAALVIAATGIFVVASLHPEYEMDVILSGLGQTVSLLTGVAAGYLAGKGRATPGTPGQ